MRLPPGLRHVFDILPAKHRSRPVAIGFVVLAVIVVALYGAGIRRVPFVPRSGHILTAEFRAADQVSTRTVVRVNGIEVGRVERVEAGSDPYRTSLVVMRITSDGIRLHQDASAQIRWRTLLGGLMYVDLHPGSAAARLNGPIPAGRTSNQVELDQLLETYAGDVAQQQRSLFTGLRAPFSDPRGIGATVQTLGPALQTVEHGLAPLLGEHTDDLPGLVAQTARTLRGLNDTANLQALVTGAARTLAVTEAQRQNLGQTLELSPPALQSTFTTMRRLRTTLELLDPLVQLLRPGARALAPAARAATPALAETEAILGDLRPLLRAAGPTFDALRNASPFGVSLIHGLQPTVDRTLTNILPWLHTRDSGTHLLNYEAIGPFWSDLAMAAGEYDSVGYRIRFTVPFGSNSFLSSPIATRMAAACAHSSLARHANECSQAIRLLGRGWFGAQMRGGR